jgi:hypothetical protein
MVWLYFLSKYLKGCLLRDLLISGMVLAASVYVRSIGYSLPPMVATGLSAWALVSDQKNKKRLVVHLVLFIMVRPLLFWSNVLLIPLELVCLLGACVVLFSRRLMREPPVVAAVLTIVYYVGISGGPAPGSFCRFRLPAMPIICVLAGYGMHLMRSRLHFRVGLQAAIWPWAG